MLDDGVTEHDLEAAVGELREISCIASQRCDVFVPPFLRRQIQAEYLDIRPACPPSIFPELIRAPNVENPQRTGQRANQGLKLPESAASKPVLKRVWSLSFCKFSK